MDLGAMTTHPMKDGPLLLHIDAVPLRSAALQLAGVIG